MGAPIFKGNMAVEEHLLRTARAEWKKFPRELDRDVPKGVQKFLGRRPGAELGDNEFSDTHFQFVLLMALTG